MSVVFREALDRNWILVEGLPPVANADAPLRIDVRKLPVLAARLAVESLLDSGRPFVVVSQPARARPSVPSWCRLTDELLRDGVQGPAWQVGSDALDFELAELGLVLDADGECAVSEAEIARWGEFRRMEQALGIAASPQ